MNSLITKWLDNPQGDLSLKELYLILEFIQNPNNKSVIDEHFKKSYREAAAAPLLHDEQIDKIYNLIQSQIHEQKKRNRSLSVDKISRFFTRAAAILLIPVSLFAVYNYLSRPSVQLDKIAVLAENPNHAVARVEYFSPPGARTRIYLPDSSEVWLNGKSKLTVSNQYGISSRDVDLLGEAFFSVQKDASKPFNVHTPDATLQVLGTTFNVSAYEEDLCVETTLVSGEVNLIYSNANKTSRVKINPSEKVSLSRAEKKITTEIVDTEVYQSWKNGKIILRNHSLKQVVSILEKWFNVTISYDVNLEEYKFTATLDNKSLDQILMFISYSSPIHYTFKDNSVHLTLRK